MERWRVLMIPTIGASLDGNGSGVIASSDPRPRTLNSFITRTIGIAISKAKLLSKSFKRRIIAQFYLLPNSVYRGLIISLTEPSHSSVSSEAIGSWTSLESTSSFRRTLFTVTSELKSSPVCIRFKSIPKMIWLSLYRIGFRNGSLQIPNTGYRSIGIAFI